MGANPNFRDEDGNSPLLLAVQYKRSERLVKQVQLPYLFSVEPEQCVHGPWAC